MRDRYALNIADINLVEPKILGT